MKRLRAVLIENSSGLEKASHCAYDVGKRLFGVRSKSFITLNVVMVMFFVVGEKGLVGKLEKNNV